MELNQIIDTSALRGTPTINPDGVSIKGCSFIYAPAGQAGEYAPLASNPYRGCSHSCAYCYVPNVLRMDRAEFYGAVTSRPNFLASLEKDARKYQAAGITDQCMFSFTCDVFNPANRELTRPSLEIVQRYGMGISTLTKGGSRALECIDLFRPAQDSFASTLTSLDDAFSRKWEPKAAPASDRVATLRRFHDRGIFTWVSLEPTLDIESSLEIVRQTHHFVDLFKIGRVNYMPLTRTTDWKSYTERMIELCQQLDVANYIKADLQPFLPPGYPNPKRVQQHH